MRNGQHRWAPPPLTFCVIAPMSEDVRRDFGLIAGISWFYLAFGLACIGLCLAGADVRGIKLGPWDAIVPAFIGVAAVGTLLKRNWGRRMSYVASAFLLLGVPIGTLFGGLMIHQLTRHRELFLKKR